jgi:hypothetical protein
MNIQVMPDGHVSSRMIYEHCGVHPHPLPFGIPNRDASDGLLSSGRAVVEKLGFAEGRLRHVFRDPRQVHPLAARDGCCRKSHFAK